MVVFDLSRAQTFPKMKEWLSDLRQSIEEDIPIVIIGNKLDLISEIGEVIERDEVHQFVEKVGYLLIETSAKTGDNVKKAFVELTRKIVQKISNSDMS